MPRSITKRWFILRWGCQLGLLPILFSAPYSLAATLQQGSATTTITTELFVSPLVTPITTQIIAQNQFFNPKFAGFDQQPRFCDLRLVNGWFYWYRQGPSVCIIVPSSNQADATAKAQELAESSNVTQAGIGYRLFGDPFF